MIIVSDTTPINYLVLIGEISNAVSLSHFQVADRQVIVARVLYGGRDLAKALAKLSG